jgi:hypothetical protein
MCELMFICDNFDAFITSQLPGVVVHDLDIIPWVLEGYMFNDKDAGLYIDLGMKLLQLYKQHFKTDKATISEFMCLYMNYKFTWRTPRNIVEFMFLFVETRSTPYIQTLQDLAQRKIPKQFMKCALQHPNLLFETLKTTDRVVSDTTLKHLEDYLTLFSTYAPNCLVYIPLYTYRGDTTMTNSSQYFIMCEWQKQVDSKHHCRKDNPPYIYSMKYVLGKTSISHVLEMFAYSMKTYWKIYDKHVP